MSIEDSSQILEKGYKLTLGSGWMETDYKTGEYGHDNKQGIEANFQANSKDAEIKILPVEYQCDQRQQRVRGLTEDVVTTSTGKEIADLPTTEPITAFAVCIRYRPIASPEVEYYTHTASAGDALAVACWISQFESDPTLIENLINVHNGAHEYPSDDKDRLDNAFGGTASRCLFEGKVTQSHEVEIPFRYGPALEGFPETHLGVPCVPEAIDCLVGVVSHSAWEEYNLTENAFKSPVERIGPGEYELDQQVSEQLQAVSVSELMPRYLGN